MSEWVVVGRVTGLHGVGGWVKIFSYTETLLGFVDYDPLYLHISGKWQPVALEAGQRHGKGVIGKFVRYDDRDAAASLLGCDIAVRREQLPELKPGEYYWNDLEGLRVETVGGLELGFVERMIETGANDVVVVKGEREHLIPFIPGEVVVEIALEQGLMRVNWDPEF